MFNLLVELQKNIALNVAQLLADSVSDRFRDQGYIGPVAIAGGYVRDLAASRLPKDLDVFVDGALVDDRHHAQRLGEQLADYLGHGAVVRTIPCYGTWAKDVDHVVKLEFPPDLAAGQEFLWMNKAPIPYGGVDIVVLRRSEWEKVHACSFLGAVCARVDTRLNCIGASAEAAGPAPYAHPAWNDDVENSRIVVQAARASEDLQRIQKRVTRLAAGKYAGWTLHKETEGGGLQPLAPPPDVTAK